MPRFKPIHRGLKLLPVDFDRQVLPGSFEHALCYLVDHEFDLSGFRARYKNDDEGASAYSNTRGQFSTHGVSSNIPTISVTLHRWLDHSDWNLRVPFITSPRAGIVGKIFS